MPESQKLCTFSVAGILFGLPVGSVQEVIRHRPMTRVPRAPAVVEGLMNLRGEVVVALDLRRRLGLPEASAGRTPMNVVVRVGDTLTSLLVDDVGDVVEPDAATFESPPGPVLEVSRQSLLGVYGMHDRLLLVLDPERVTKP
jgi:purine-binding chemotaxis protein CheW